MSRLRPYISTIALIVIGLTSPAISQELPPGSSIPDKTYELVTEYLLNGVPYISGFECLVHGKNIVREPACDYYKAVVSSSLMISKTSEEICFKELTSVSVPREYEAETIYRIITETKLGRQGGDFEGVTLARILSLPELPEWKTTLWYETTTVALYDCDIPYDGKSYN